MKKFRFYKSKLSLFSKASLTRNDIWFTQNQLMGVYKVDFDLAKVTLVKIEFEV